MLVIGGCVEVPGAALLASVAALRAGAGKLQIATVRSVAVALGLAVPEALVTGHDEIPDGGIDPVVTDALIGRIERCDAVLVGPGMTGDAATVTLVEALAAHACDAALILDAAALECSHAVLRRPAGHAVLTPHAGEMAKLLDTSRNAILADPEAHVCDAARPTGSIVALKGSTTPIATPDGRVFRYGGGGVGLATSSSGDTLAGIVTGLAARGCDPLTAAIWGVFLHGEVGVLLTHTIGRVGFLARELLDEVPRVMAAHCD